VVFDKTLYPIFIIVSAALIWICTSNYFRGMSIGFVALFVTALLIVPLLHHRLRT